MGGGAGDDDVENIASERVRAAADRNLAGRRIGIDMNADGAVDIIEHSLLDHPPPTQGFGFLGRLEDEAYRAAEALAHTMQMRRRGEDHG